MEQVRVVLDWFPNTNHTGFYVAKKQGYFADAGLEVQIDGDVHGVLSTEGADIVLGPMISMLEQRVKGIEITAIATITQRNDSGIVSLASAGIEKPSDLEGKRLTHWEPRWFHEVIGEAVRQDGGDYSKVNLVPMDVGDIVSTLGETADATWVYENWENQELLAAGKAINFIRLADLSPLFDFPAPSIGATRSFLDSRPEVARRFLHALERGYTEAAQAPEASILEVREHMPNVSTELLVASQKHLAAISLNESGKWGRISAERWEPMAQFLVDTGITTSRFDNEFSNDFFA